jgi:hypothetical protein
LEGLLRPLGYARCLAWCDDPGTPMAVEAEEATGCAGYGAGVEGWDADAVGWRFAHLCEIVSMVLLVREDWTSVPSSFDEPTLRRWAVFLRMSMADRALSTGAPAANVAADAVVRVLVHRYGDEAVRAAAASWARCATAGLGGAVGCAQLVRRTPQPSVESAAFVGHAAAVLLGAQFPPRPGAGSDETPGANLGRLLGSLVEYVRTRRDEEFAGLAGAGSQPPLWIDCQSFVVLMHQYALFVALPAVPNGLKACASLREQMAQLRRLLPTCDRPDVARLVTSIAFFETAVEIVEDALQRSETRRRSQLRVGNVQFRRA